MVTDLFSGFDDQNFNLFPSSVVLVLDFFTVSLLLGCIFYHSGVVRLLGVVFMIKGWAWGLVRLSEGLRLGGFSLMAVSLFLFLFFNNLAGLFPYIFSWTSHVSLSLTVAVPFWMSLFISGFLWHSAVVLAHWLPSGASLSLSVILVLGETISTFLRPFSLSLRLAVNMTAGHVFVGLTSKGLAMGLVNGLNPLLLLVCGGFLFGLLMAEMVVCLIQSLVFVLLLTLYSNEHPNVSSYAAQECGVTLFYLKWVHPFIKSKFGWVVAV